MSTRRTDRVPVAAGIAFVLLAVAGNALQGSTPALHGDAAAVAEFYSDGPTRIAVAMMASLVSLFFLAVFLAAFGRVPGLDGARGGWPGGMVRSGGTATVALLAGGFALNSAGALRAGGAGPIPPGTAAVFYDAGLALAGLAAPLAMAVLLAGTAVATGSGVFPRWFGRLSAALGTIGVLTPVSFVLFLLFPAWVLAACAALTRHRAPVADGSPTPAAAR